MSVSISFLGDISLNDEYVKLQKTGIDPFVDVSPILKKSDWVVGNLEAMATTGTQYNEYKAPRLLTRPATLNYLKSIGLNMVTLAHNHAYDHLEQGFEETVQALNQLNIRYMGSGLDKKTANQPLIKEIDGLRFGFLNYNHPDTNPKVPKGARFYINTFELETVLADINTLKPQADFIIVLLHWGGKIEGSNFPEPIQRDWARRMIDAGASMVVGGHSHTLQAQEVYNQGHIIYSLGNFCFADIEFNGKLICQDGVRRSVSAIATARFTKGKAPEVSYVGISNQNLSIVKDDSVLRQLHRRQGLYQLLMNFPLAWRANYFLFKRLYPIFAFVFRNGLNHEKSVLRQFKLLFVKLYEKVK